MMKVVIVGGVAGGASAAARIRRLDEHAQDVYKRQPMSRSPSTSARRGRQWHGCSNAFRRTGWWS